MKRKARTLIQYVLEKFNTHFVSLYHKSTSFTREQRFISGSKREGESVEEYVRSLFELSEHAQFAEKEETDSP